MNHRENQNLVTQGLIDRVLENSSSEAFAKQMIHWEENEPALYRAMNRLCQEYLDQIAESYPLIRNTQPRVFPDFFSMGHLIFMRAFLLGKASIEDLLPGLSEELQLLYLTTPVEERTDSYR